MSDCPTCGGALSNELVCRPCLVTKIHTELLAAQRQYTEAVLSGQKRLSLACEYGGGRKWHLALFGSQKSLAWCGKELASTGMKRVEMKWSQTTRDLACPACLKAFDKITGQDVPW